MVPVRPTSPPGRSPSDHAHPPRSVVIVGAGLAGAQTVLALCEQGFDGHVTVLGAEGIAATTTVSIATIGYRTPRGSRGSGTRARAASSDSWSRSVSSDRSTPTGTVADRGKGSSGTGAVRHDGMAGTVLQQIWNLRQLHDQREGRACPIPARRVAPSNAHVSGPPHRQRNDPDRGLQPNSGELCWRSALRCSFFAPGLVFEPGL